jgi:hypothetical protein
MLEDSLLAISGSDLLLSRAKLTSDVSRPVRAVSDFLLDCPNQKAPLQKERSRSFSMAFFHLSIVNHPWRGSFGKWISYSMMGT